MVALEHDPLEAIHWGKKEQENLQSRMDGPGLHLMEAIYCGRRVMIGAALWVSCVSKIRLETPYQQMWGQIWEVFWVLCFEGTRQAILRRL